MNLKRGIVLKLLWALSATLMLACVRGLHGAIPTGEVVFFRSVFALLPLLIWYGTRGELGTVVRTRSVTSHFGRGLSGTGGMFFNYMALAYIPLAQATAFSYAAPLFTVIFAAVLLREVVRIYRWSAVAIGFAGVLVMLIPALAAAGSGAGQQVFLTGAGAALVAAACSALSVIQIRRMTASESPGAIVFWFAVLTTLIGASTAIFGWEMPDTQQAMLLIGCGLFGGLQQVLVTLALREAHASLLAPFDYSTMIWSVLIGWLAFSVVPDVTTLVGSVIVIGAGLFTLWRENVARRSHNAAA